MQGEKQLLKRNALRETQKLLRKIGWDVRRLTPSSNFSLRLLKMFERFEIDLVLDVGANVGQFGEEIRSIGYKGNIVSFEPLSAAYKILLEKARQDKKWYVHKRCAIGDRDGQIEINISGNSVSSSVLAMTALHVAACENSKYVSTENVPIRRLDFVAKEYIIKFSQPFLKIDAQGFESQVLDGASETLPQIKGVLCELSLVPLYEGGCLWTDMIYRLSASGFTLWSIQNGFTDSRDGRTLQMDATFFRL